jgi:protein-S-isoprenylcysteine O-methyltransferase Ste14
MDVPLLSLKEMRMKERKGEHPFGDAGQLILLGLFLVVWAGDSFFVRKSTFLWDGVPLFIRLTILGLVLIPAFYLFLSGHVAVAHGERPASVLSTGAFRYVRHPLYLAAMLVYLGLAVSTASLFSLLLLVIIFLFYNYIAGYEERLMEIKFGTDYVSYKNKTGKWVPMCHVRDAGK